MFSKKDRKYIALLLITLIGLFLVEFYAPQPVDWSHTYSQSDKIPYGNYILFNELESIIGTEVETSNLTAYELSSSGDLEKYNSLLYIQEQFAPADLDASSILKWVAQGNQVFIASNEFSGSFADTLKLKTSFEFNFSFNDGERELEDSDKGFDKNGLNFINPKLHHTEDFSYKKGSLTSFFTKFDTANTEILGENAEGEINFVKVNWGAGNIYLNSSPLAFTNYNLLLNDNHLYVSKALSYLTEGNKLLWDEYYKAGRLGPQTPLRFVLSKPALKWAWFLVMATLFTFIIFNVKRKQRIIPIVEPPKNSSLEFVETIGKLYFQAKDFNDLAKKKGIYFKEYLRQHNCHVQGKYNQTDIDYISKKAGVPLEQAQKLFYSIERAEEGNSTSEEQLLQLSQQIEFFKKNSVFS